MTRSTTPAAARRPPAIGQCFGWARYRLARFDCAAWDYPLDGGRAPHVIHARITDDESVWVLTGEERDGTDPLADMGPRQLYVITPEAVAGTE